MPTQVLTVADAARPALEEVLREALGTKGFTKYDLPDGDPAGTHCVYQFTLGKPVVCLSRDSVWVADHRRSASRLQYDLTDPALPGFRGWLDGALDEVIARCNYLH